LSGEYLHGIFTDDDSATATITVSEPVPEAFEVTNLQAPATATAGDLIDVSADVTNTGDESATKTVEFRLDVDQSGTLDADEALDSVSLTLASGETQPVTFTGIDTTGLSGEYLHGVVSPDTAATATITVSEPVPATFEVSNLQAPATVTQGDVIDVSADVTNTGDESATKTVEFRLDLDDDASIDDETAFLSEDVTLAPGETQTVTFSGIDTASLVADTYVHGVVTPDDVATATLTVEEPATERTIRIVGEGPRIGYEIVVDDTFTGGEGLQSSDSISADGTTATGFVSTGSDEYTFVGNVESILLDGPAMVYIDGELVDPADFGDEHVITLIGDGTPGSYEFVVGGEITGGVGLQNSDEFEGRLASGFVSGGSDEYTYTGDLQAIDVTPGVTVLVDGVEVDPSTFADVHQISFVGDGVRSDYEFTIDGEIVGGDGLAGSDTFTSASGSGSVWGATDTYYYVGALEPISVTVDGGATVLVDGTEYTGTVASLATPTGLVVVFG
jgi:acyl-CoA hydrolase